VAAHGVELAQRRSGLIVPPEYADRRPAFRCNVCGAEFPNEQRGSWQRHVGECARVHAAEIEAMRPSVRNKGGPFDPENWNPDAEAHLRKVGKRMLREGRMTLKRNEKIYDE
jgi:hypothetical protein